MRNTAPVLKSNCWSWQHTHNCTGDIRNGKIQVCRGGLDTSPPCAGEGPARMKCLSAPHWSPRGAAREAGNSDGAQPSLKDSACLHQVPQKAHPLPRAEAADKLMKDVCCLADLSSLLDTSSRGGKEKRQYSGPRKQNTLLTQQWVRL